jgi:hypothetical protein
MLLLALLLTTSTAIGVVAYLVAARSQKAGAIGASVFLVLLIGKSLLHWKPHWEAMLFPWPDYSYFQQFAIYPLVVVFFGFAAARLPILWNRIVVGLVGLSFLGYGAWENSWIAWPQQHGGDIYADARNHRQQSTHYTCGPAACMAAASHFGVKISERDMAKLCLTRTGGSRLFNLYRGLQLALPDGEFRVRIVDLSADDLLERGRVVVTSNSGHALCIVGKGTRVLVHNPLYPDPSHWNRGKLTKNYRGPAVLVERSTR